MKIEKTFTINAPQREVWEFITSPELIAPCIPGCEGAEETEPGKYKASIRTKVGPIKTTFTVDIERTEQRPPEFASYDTKGDEGSRASRIKAATSLTLRKVEPDHTEVSYFSDIHIMGRLGKFGSGMMQKIADGIGDEFVAALKERLEGRMPEAPGALPSPEAPPSKALLWWAIGIGIGIGVAALIIKLVL